MAVEARGRQVSPETLRPHFLSSLVPPMRKDEWDEFYADVAIRGIKLAVEMDGEGTILAERLGWLAIRLQGPQTPCSGGAKCLTLLARGSIMGLW